MYVFLINLILVCWALHQFNKFKSLSSLRMRQIEQSGVDLKTYLWPSVLVGFLSCSWREEFINQSRLWRSQVWDFRRFLFSSSQTLFSFFGVFLCFALFLELSSYAVLGIGFVVWALCRLPKLRDWPSLQVLSALIYLGLTLFFLELAFKNSGLLMQYLMDTEIVFWLTLDSALNLLSILLTSTVLGLLVPVQGWSLVISFLLYLNSQASFLTFTFIILGELIGTSLYLIYNVRAWDGFYRKKIRGLLVCIMGYLLFFVGAVYMWRYFFSLGGAYNQLMFLKWIFLATVFIMLAGLYIVVMTWGHFAAANPDRDIVISDAGLIGELKSSLGDPVTQVIVSQLYQRHEKLLGYRRDLQNESENVRKKIPPFVLNQFEEEIKIIESLKS